MSSRQGRVGLGGLFLLLLGACTSATADTDAGRMDAGAIDASTMDAPIVDLGLLDGSAAMDLAGCDEDGDGALSMACGGNDCDDHAPLRAPGHTEICDAANVDEDCDPTTFGSRDEDGDGYVDMLCCNADPAGGMHCGDDCNDTSPHDHPGAPELCDHRDNDCNGLVDDGASASEPEVCNGVDDNCNGMIDEGVTTTYYEDADHDGHGSPSGATMMACSPPAGYVASNDDCDDTNAAVHPGAVELCDAAMLDEDCDGIANPPSLCSCTSGASRMCSAPGACASGIELCAGGTWGACSIGPVAETCNGIDDDCDGVVDNGVSITCYADADDDGYAPAGASIIVACPVPSRPAVGGCPSGETNRPPLDATSIDCNDASAAIHPGAGCP